MNTGRSENLNSVGSTKDAVQLPRQFHLYGYTAAQAHVLLLASDVH